MIAARTWGLIGAVVVTASSGDVLTARAMKKVGDLDAIRAARGVPGQIKAVLTCPAFALGILAMTVSFFTLLTALSWADVSLVAPASASLTFVSNAVAGKYILKERVDHRRWLAALFICGGVALLSR